MPSKTPMEAAYRAAADAIDGAMTDAAYEIVKSEAEWATHTAVVVAAITAYLTALPEDKETVERVATAIELCDKPYSSEHVALASLRALTAKE